ncbi:MAG: sulfatase [Planctomycetaceae bacterium]|nr:sulfatase [Planctomycetaceae bacterium]
MRRQTRVPCKRMFVVLLCSGLTGGLAADCEAVGHSDGAVAATAKSEPRARPRYSPSPDVIMVIVDDLNDWISLLDPQGPVRTPHLRRLARRGVLFRRAYCVSPACNPSRVATLTGLRPATSGVYGNASDWRRALPDRLTITQQFRNAGYYVAGAGKVFHHHLNGAFHDPASFVHFTPMTPQQYPASKLNRAPEYGSRNTDWGPWPPGDEQTIDYQTVTRCIEVLEDHDADQPLFLTCGLFKPHSPFFAPPQWHRPIDALPQRLADDRGDLPAGAHQLMKRKDWFWQGMQAVEQRQPGAWQDFIGSYVACAEFVDAQLGRLLDAVDRSDRYRNAVMLLWSDHGFHLGEKDHIEKFALWEKTTHIPFVIVAPGVARANTVCDRPLDLSVLYPTLLELAGLPPDESADGRSVVPLLRDPTRPWSEPAVMTYQRGNHAVRSQRWRYIRYRDGSEELYDHTTDPHEWHNLAEPKHGKVRDEYRQVMNEHRRWLPDSEAAPVPDLKKH